MAEQLCEGDRVRLVSGKFDQRPVRLSWVEQAMGTDPEDIERAIGVEPQELLGGQIFLRVRLAGNPTCAEERLDGRSLVAGEGRAAGPD